MKNKVVREVIDFVKAHRSLFDHVLREDISQSDELVMEQINLVVGILSKVRITSVFLFASDLLNKMWSISLSLSQL